MTTLAPVVGLIAALVLASILTSWLRDERTDIGRNENQDGGRAALGIINLLNPQNYTRRGRIGVYLLWVLTAVQIACAGWFVWTGAVQ